MRLTSNQRHALAGLADGRVPAIAEYVYGGPRTFRSLERHGLIRYYPYGDHGSGSYGLSCRGRELLAKLESKDLS